MFSRVKGVSDIFFDMSYWRGVRKKIETHLHRYNFSQVQLPTLEHVSLFQRGLGYETDVVSKQMFTIETKGKKDEPICLRPEATAGTMRAFLEQKAQITTPYKLFSYGPMFRYERPQKGRLREFYQMNLEMIGAASITHDAYFIKMLYTLFLEEFKIQSFALKVNFLGQPEDRQKFCQALQEFLLQDRDNLCGTCQIRVETNVLRILDCKSESCQAIIQNGPKLFDYFSDQTKAEWQQLCDLLQELSVTFIHDQQLVRGLDYYNKTVFEFVSTDLGAQSAFCAGGRYDGLATQLGSKQEIPAIGCAMGMERLLMVLESNKEQLVEQQAPLTCIIPFDQEQTTLALLLADSLQAKGKRVDVLVDSGKIKQKMKKAHNMQSQFVLLLGEQEQQDNTVTCKNMLTGQEETVLQDEVHRKLP